MSTSETVELELGPCPCGKGRIVKRVTTQDNPWSAADICMALECADCRRAWRLEGDGLVLRTSEADYLQAREAEQRIRQSLHNLVDQLVSEYFDRFAAPTRKAEHKEMMRLGITSMSYPMYLAHRRQGRRMAAACYGLRNTEWLRGLAVARSLESILDNLLNQESAAQEATATASASIVRRQIAYGELHPN